MRIDLKQLYSEGRNFLYTLRDQYAKSGYPEQVLLYLFYRKYTMEFMWGNILDCFPELRWSKWNYYDEGLRKLKLIYNETVASKTEPVISKLLSEQPERKVGSISYSDYKQHILGANQGNKTDIEKIEYDYLYHFLSDECILLWGAYGGLGATKLDAIVMISDVIIEETPIDTYTQIEGILGPICATSYLSQVYKPLPPMG